MLHITAQQIALYAQCGWIEFENFVSKKEVEQIAAGIAEVVAKRLQVTPDRLSRFAFQRLYLSSRDCWRDNPTLLRFFRGQRFASTAAHLCNQQPLYLACDQWIPKESNFSPLNLTAHLSFQDLSCGCLLNLEQGTARFMQPDRLPLFKESQILIAYGNSRTLYVHHPLDPSNALLKRYGYNFGDHLQKEHHPICQSSP